MVATRSQIHERTISLRFLGITIGVLRREISVYNVYNKNEFQTTFAQEGEGEKNLLVEVTMNSKEENSLSQLHPRIRSLESGLPPPVLPKVKTTFNTCASAVVAHFETVTKRTALLGQWII
jgi:hypothetical protein